MTNEARPAGKLIAELTRIIDTDHVVIDEAAPKQLSADLSSAPGEIADVVVTPAGATKAFCAEHRDVIEPGLYRHDEPGEFCLSPIKNGFQQQWTTFTPEPGKRRAALELRDKLHDVCDSHGGCHRQLRKYYPHRELIANEALKQLLNGVRGLREPVRSMNPGLLGVR